MSDDERRVWLQTYCEDLGAYTDAEIGNACKRYRQDGANRYFPTPGALLDLMKNPYADPPTARRGNDLWARLGFGGGGCICPKCAAEDYRRAEATRAELKAWTDYQIERRCLSRLDEAERHTRFLMTQELVRDHGWEWEDARRKVMVERTRALYPEFTIWPVIGSNSPSP